MAKQIISINIPGRTAISILFIALILLVTSLCLWFQGVVDEAIILFHNPFHQNPTAIAVFQLISRYGMGFISLMIGVYAFFVNKSEELSAAKPYLLFVLLTFAFASIFGDLLKEILGRPRPAAVLINQIANTTLANSPAFPSGHATKSMALTLPFALVVPEKDRKTCIVKFITLIAAILVSYSRVVLQRHYLSDVLAGIAIAFFFIPIGNRIVNLFYQKLRIDHKKLDMLAKRLGFVFFLLVIPLCML